MPGHRDHGNFRELHRRRNGRKPVMEVTMTMIQLLITAVNESRLDNHEKEMTRTFLDHLQYMRLVNKSLKVVGDG